MRCSEGALAWITRDGAMGQEWLTRWNRKWNNRSLIGGHREDGESFRECLVREIYEETGIREGEDYVMSSEPILHLEYSAFSQRANEETAYVMVLFRVDLAGDDVEQRLAGDDRLAWVSGQEADCGRAQDGSVVSDTLQRFIKAYREEYDAADPGP